MTALVTRRKARAAVVGVGHSRIFRRDDVPLGELALEACRAAIADAGLKPSDIDGVASDPNQPVDGAGEVDGLDLVTPILMIDALGLKTRWAQQVYASTVGKTVIHAVNAVAAGACRHALVFKALHSPKGRYGHVDPVSMSGYGRAGQGGQFVGIYGVTPVAGAGLLMQRYFQKYGATKEQLGRFLVENRKVALQWDWGYWKTFRPQELTLEQYLAARPICEPLGLYDCDLPVQGCAAMVITSPERARDLRRNPAYVIGAATPEPTIRNQPWLLEPYQRVGRRYAEALYADAGIGPADVDVANLYDGFSIFPSLWMENLGFCAEGEGMAALADPRSRLDGSRPINTSSGNLGSGRMHGMPHILDAALQAMGRSGTRQAKKADVSLVVIGPPMDGAGLVFSRHPS